MDSEIAKKLIGDPRYFIERCFTIVDQSSQEVPFLFNPVQADYYDQRSAMDIIVKSRKMGFSALITAIFLHACLTRMHTRAVVISHEEEATLRMFRRVKHYLTSLKDLKVEAQTTKDSQNELMFPDTKSWFYLGTAGAKSFGRGEDLTHVHLSESAHYDSRDIITGVQEALIKGAPTWIVQESTARGAGTKFHESWLRAVRGESGWRHHFFGWHQDALNRVKGAEPVALHDEERRLREALALDWEQIAWRRAKLASMDDPNLFPQEYPATAEDAFIASGSMIFDWAAIRRNEETASAPKWRGHLLDLGGRLDIQPDGKGPLTIWVSPTERTKYLIVADTAQGIPGAAYSVADVYDIRTWEQVAQWRGHADPKEFAAVLARLGAFYGWALVAVENNYPGNAILAYLSEMSYPNIWDDPSEPGEELGFKTTEKSKRQYISDEREALKDGSLKINSPATCNELKTFVLLGNGKMGPQGGCWQDTVVVMSKAASILKTLHLEPEIIRKSFRDVMGFRRGRSGVAGGNYSTGVV